MISIHQIGKVWSKKFLKHIQIFVILFLLKKMLRIKNYMIWFLSLEII